MSNFGEDAIVVCLDGLIDMLERIEAQLKRIADKPPTVDEIEYEKRRDE